jgi:hypothetical protein
MNEGLERNGRHGGMMLKNRVNANYSQIGVAEQAVRTFGLWCSMGHAPRTQHLERMQQDDASAK